jgi:uncharacterized protein YidB (DUF937 family)
MRELNDEGTGGANAEGGLGDLLGGLAGPSEGLGDVVGGLAGGGASGRISGADVRRVVGDEELARIAAELGVSADEAADAVAQVLPEVVRETREKD